MSFTIKKKIYWSFSLLVILFVTNGIITIATLNNNKKASRHISNVSHPSIKAIYDFRKILLQSQMFSTNWVFLRSSQKDKDALLKIHSQEYPELKSRLLLLSSNWYHQEMADSLRKMLNGFEGLMHNEKYIINSLQKFSDYDDALKKFGAEEQLENIILPQTSELMNQLYKILAHEEGVRVQEETNLGRSSIILRTMISILAILIVLIGIFLSVYMSKIIIRPIHKIHNIINNLGKGITNKVDYKTSGDEIGEMVRSVNNLSENLRVSALFANEIGKRNFNNPFKPLSEEDALGKALITMRDNLRSTDESLNEAQHIAKLGSWEKNVITNKVTWSDELYDILEGDAQTFDKINSNFTDFVHPDEREHVKELLTKFYTNKDNIDYQCRIITPKGNTKWIQLQGKGVVGANGQLIKTFGVVQDITQRKATEEVLITSNAELRKTNSELDKFVYSVSHDLRAPLCSMLGVLEIAQEDTTEELMLDHLKMLQGNVKKLDGFIGDILDYSRNSRIEVKKEQINFKELINDVSENLKFMGAGNRKIDIIIDVNDNSAVNSDKNRLSIILNNLVSNAIRYQNFQVPNPYVDIKIDTSDTETGIIIRDNGIGISKEQHQKIFDMFFRVSEQSVGSGLGLYIVKEAISKLNGSIQVQSEIGQGTTFIINIPNN